MGPIRKAYLLTESLPVTFAAHGAVAAHYKVPQAVLPHATTLDYIVAATAG
jgi:hypothetical protein